MLPKAQTSETQPFQALGRQGRARRRMLTETLQSDPFGLAGWILYPGQGEKTRTVEKIMPLKYSEMLLANLSPMRLTPSVIINPLSSYYTEIKTRKTHGT